MSSGERAARREARRSEKRARGDAEKRARAYLKTHEPIASWGKRIHLCPDRLVRFGPRVGPEKQSPEMVPLDGVRAEFGPAPEAGGTSRVGVRGRIDARQQWLTISGASFRWQDPVPTAVAEVAREFATAVNDHVAGRSTGER